MNWNHYIKQTSNKDPRPLLVEALSYARQGMALDLGAGALNDSKLLLESGFYPVIVDSSPAVKVLAKELPVASVHIVPFHQFEFPKATYTLVSAQFSLPFCGQKYIKQVVEEMKDSIKSGGIFTGQFFGLKHQWANDPNIIFSTYEEVEEYFEGWIIHKLDEEIGNKKDANGRIGQWHIFNVIAEKR